MRSKLNLQGSTRRIADKLLPHMPVPRMPLTRMSVSPMPMEWLDAGSWRLPSGKALAEFALQAGFLAPLLLKSEHFGARHRQAGGTSTGQMVATGAEKFGKGK